MVFIDVKRDFFGPKHTIVQSDVDKYLIKTFNEGRRFTLAFVDPPSFFQDFKKKISFDINKDHPDLLQKVLKVMAPGSTVRTFCSKSGWSLLMSKEIFFLKS